MTRDKNAKKMIGKVIHGLTPEERFKEVRGMSIEERHAKLKEEFKAKTGMIYEL
ncbi:hypothetical protein AB1K32_04360 [Metabacillus dongyingensis]|uniref:hypothetical protein n=1 Tax=Metabacillus dongyingensis TaxID=2874282 RepID=UPI003B8A9FC1